MRQASDVKFLAVQGTIMIGDVPLYYQFTLVKYYLYIDTVPWVIFSNLNDALLYEFDSKFWTTLNCDRKDRWGFQEVAWLKGTEEYDVDTPYYDTLLSIFDTYGNTCREVRPFEYNHDHLRVHVNGAAIYSEEKKLVFLLPLIVETHRLLPDTPIFWANDNSTLSLYRTSMWMDEDTIKWLAETGARYPAALRTQIQPRIDAIRNAQHGQRQPPTPPQPNRWQERRPERSDQPSTQDPPPKPQPVKLSPRHMVADDNLCMDMQEEFLEIATSTTPQGGSSKSARASQSAADEGHSKPPKQKSPDNTAKVKKRSKEGSQSGSRKNSGPAACTSYTESRKRMLRKQLNQIKRVLNKRRRKRKHKHRSPPHMTVHLPAHPAQMHQMSQKKRKNLTRMKKRDRAVKNPTHQTLRRKQLTGRTYQPLTRCKELPIQEACHSIGFTCSN